MNIEFISLSIIIGVCGLVLSSCDREPSKYLKICTESHTEVRPITVPTGVGVSTQFVATTVCDKYEVKENPEYKKWMSQLVEDV